MTPIVLPLKRDFSYQQRTIGVPNRRDDSSRSRPKIWAHGGIRTIIGICKVLRQSTEAAHLNAVAARWAAAAALLGGMAAILENGHVLLLVMARL